MAVTLEQAHILVKEVNMCPSEFQHSLDVMRRYIVHVLYVYTWSF